MILETILLGLSLVVTVFTATTMFWPGGKRGEDAVTSKVQHLVSGRSMHLERQLRLLRIPLTRYQYLLAVALLGLACGLTVLEFNPQYPPLGALAMVSLIAAVLLSVREVAATLTNRFEQNLVDALDLLYAGVQAGETPQGALMVVAEASTGAVRQEFREIANSLALGLSIDRAIARIVDLYDSEGVRVFAQALLVKWQVGGDFSALIKSVSRVVRERVALRLKISSQLSGAKYSSILIAIAPYAVVPFFVAKDPRWLDTLSNHPLGPQFLMMAILLQLFGFYWLRNILRTH